MANPHSSVMYVEPNYVFSGLTNAAGDGNTYDRAPDLEDYCIALDIIVELSSKKKSIREMERDNRVIVMSYVDNGGGTKSNVSFMSGTRVGGYTKDDKGEYKPNLAGENVLTSYYADMYVTDLVDYGTTELLGIKSVDIDYNSTCVPVITIKFTDVRGMSIFQPSELNDDMSYNGIRGFSRDNIAQSFFHAFFTLPLPKFTIRLKGFYGEPVSYQVMCDKFDTAFDSNTGSFDVTARFIGYAYSYMSDISLNVLMAAPYSDFEGENYWETQCNSGRFTIPGKSGERQRMPKLYEIRRTIEDVLNDPDSAGNPSSNEAESENHLGEIEKLKGLVDMYMKWYTELYAACRTSYGQDYCFKIGGGYDDEYTCVLVLTNGESVTGNDFSSHFSDLNEAFRNLSGQLDAAIKEYNSSGSSPIKLDEIRKDFAYPKMRLFNNISISDKTKDFIFNGLHTDCRLPKNELMGIVFGTETVSHQNACKVIYGDGEKQYVEAFVIDLKYSDIIKRIKILSDTINKQQDDKEKERNALNQRMYDKLEWYPTIENFTKVVMAHVETLAHMMYAVVDGCEGRTLESLGVSTGDYGVVDMNNNEETVAPFPRFTSLVTDSDGYSKSEDAWVGNYINGVGFKEVDLINGLFNGVKKIEDIEGDIERARRNAELNAERVEEEGIKSIIAYPTTTFDFSITGNPYSVSEDFDSGDACNSLGGFAGKVIMRMYDVLAVNSFREEFYANWTNFAIELGKIEAYNFNKLNKISSAKLLGLISAYGDYGTGEKFLNIALGKSGIKEIPWAGTNENDNELLIEDGNLLYYSRYLTDSNEDNCRVIIPTHDLSFKRLTTTTNELADIDKYVYHNGWTVYGAFGLSSDKVINMVDNENETDTGVGFGEIRFTDDFKSIWSKLDESMSMATDLTEYNTLFSRDLYTRVKPDFAAAKDSPILVKEGNYSFNRVVEDEYVPSETTWQPASPSDAKASAGVVKTVASIPDDAQYVDDGFVQVNEFESVKQKHYEFDPNTDTELYVKEMVDRNIQSFTLTECYNYFRETGYDKSKSLFFDSWLYEQNDITQDITFLLSIDCIDYNGFVKNRLNTNNNRSFIYLPKLAFLQISALIDQFYDYGRRYNFNTEFSLQMKKGEDYTFYKEKFGTIVKWVNTLSPYAKMGLCNYFRDWSRKNHSLVSKLFLKKYIKEDGTIDCESIKSPHYSNIMGDGKKVARAIFNQKSDVIKKLTNDLMGMTLMIREYTSSVNKDYTAYRINKSTAISYLDSFLDTIRTLNDMPNMQGGPTTIAGEPSQTTEDMKIELYRYLKQFYDKWISTAKEDSWKYEQFFGNADSSSAIGNNFFFIDSFYNKIGDKLLLNPMTISDVMKLTTASKDTNVMMYNFLAQLYAEHRCMIKCVQNFKNLANGITNIFQPIAYNEMGPINVFPDFVVIYAYEASRNLNVQNSEYKDDGFMLNEEFETPLPIRSRGDETAYYKIPAFGVSYGRQYQHYFKAVNVNMEHPVLTEQAIIAKHNILSASKNQHQKGVGAQDLYDIYSNQSYTCNVEMMGCAYVQPLMYFVLLNVPFFKGSYLISKVKHTMTPGNMTTTITGVRMSKYCNKMVTNMFTDDEDTTPGGETYADTMKHLMTDTSNDCPYKYFPIDETVHDVSGVKVLQELVDIGASNIMPLLIQNGCSEAMAAGIAGNMAVESGFIRDNINKNDSGTGTMSGGLIQWRAGNLVALMLYAKKDPINGDRHGRIGKKNNNLEGEWAEPVTKDESDEFPKIKTGEANYEYCRTKLQGISEEKQIEYLIATLKSGKSYHKFGVCFDSLKDIGDDAEAAKIIAIKFRDGYEICADSSDARAAYAEKIFNRYKEGSGGSTPVAESNINVRGFAKRYFKAIQKSLNSTGNYKANLKATYGNSDGSILITTDSGNEKLTVLLDIILNTDGYYKHVKGLYYNVNNSATEDPKNLLVVVSEFSQSREFTIRGNNIGRSNRFNGTTGDCNTRLMQSLAKKYGNDKNQFVKEWPQFKDAKDSIDSFKPKDCSSLYNAEIVETPSEVESTDNIKIDNWDVEASCREIIGTEVGCKTVGGKVRCGESLCATHVEDAIAKGGLPRMHCGGNGHATNLRYKKILEQNNFRPIYGGTIGPRGNPSIALQAGDVAIIGTEKGYPYHACMYTASKGWVSDFIQQNMNPYSSAQPFMIYRYQNKKGTKKS